MKSKASFTKEEFMQLAKELNEYEGWSKFGHIDDVWKHQRERCSKDMVPFTKQQLIGLAIVIQEIPDEWAEIAEHTWNIRKEAHMTKKGN